MFPVRRPTLAALAVAALLISSSRKEVEERPSVKETVFTTLSPTEVNSSDVKE